MFIKIFISISFVFLLSHCGLPSTEVPEDHYYRLGDAVPDQVVKKQLKNMIIKQVKARGIYNERAILYRQSSSPLEIHRYNYRYWTHTPAQLIHAYMQQYFQPIIVPSNMHHEKQRKSDFLIQVEIIRFERLLEKGNSFVDIALKVDRNNVSKIYSAKIRAEKAGMHATVEAFTEGLKRIMQQIISDLPE